MTDPLKEIHVVVPVYKATPETTQCLESIIGALHFSPSWEIIVVDNGGNDQLKEQLASLPVKVISKTEKASAAYARNRGANDFQQGILVFMDNDVVVEKDCIEKLIQPIRLRQANATIGNYSTNLEGLTFPQKYKQLYIHHAYDRADAEVRNEFWTAISAIDAPVFHNLGGFDESFQGAAGEDTDFGVRLTKNNFKIMFVKDALGKHLHRYTISGIIRNDFKKGLAAIRNSLVNKVPLSDNRHSSSSDKWAVVFSCLTMSFLIAGIVWIPALLFTIPVLFMWLNSRWNLICLYFSHISITGFMKALSLMFMLDLVRAACVVVGVTKNLKPIHHIISPKTPVENNPAL